MEKAFNAIKAITEFLSRNSGEHKRHYLCSWAIQVQIAHRAILLGYVSANLYIRDDGKTVTSYAQWKTLQDFQNILKNEKAQKHMKLAGSLATEFKPVTYNSIWTHSNND